MVKVRIQSDRPAARFNVLLTEDRPHAPEHWTAQLPRLLEPQGIAAYVARTGQEAIELAESMEIHAAILDLAMPLGGSDDSKKRVALEAAGLKLLELFSRLPNRPPMVVIHRPAYSREADRLMRESLRLGAFSVLHKPVEIEQLLSVFRRLLDRQYRGHWPGAQGSQGPSSQPDHPQPPRRPRGSGN